MFVNRGLGNSQSCLLTGGPSILLLLRGPGFLGQTTFVNSVTHMGTNAGEQRGVYLINHQRIRTWLGYRGTQSGASRSGCAGRPANVSSGSTAARIKKEVSLQSGTNRPSGVEPCKTRGETFGPTAPRHNAWTQVGHALLVKDRMCPARQVQRRRSFAFSMCDCFLLMK